MTETATRLELRGVLTALVTPFTAEGGVDSTALARLVGRQLELGVHGLVPCGSTGEAATLDNEERVRVIEQVARLTEGRVPVVAGCGGNDTRRTVAMARAAAAAGADALLVVSPYYNKPNRSGLLAHFEAVAAATPRPIVIYNVPGRTGQNLGAELILRLAEIPGVAGVKEASADLDQIAWILRDRPPGFAVLSGDDNLTLPAMALGADGVISVLSNELPSEMSRLASAALEGDLDEARELHYRLMPLMRANFVESNPIPVKVALSLLGLCRPDVRPPLGPASEATRLALREALSDVGVEDVGR
jgi:4-hydroxy-tetrahydrodipicolinate synthase